MPLSVQRLITIVIVSTALPLVSIASHGQTCAPESLRQTVEQLQDNQKRSEAQKALQACGEGVVQPLVFALTDNFPKVAIIL